MSSKSANDQSLVAIEFVPNPDLTIELSVHHDYTDKEEELLCAWLNLDSPNSLKKLTKINVKTSSDLMATVSKPFRTFLRPEGLLASLLKEIGHATIEIDDDDVIASLLLHFIIAHKKKSLPELVSVPTLLQFCLLIDKYMLHDVANDTGREFLKNLTGVPFRTLGRKYKLAIYWVLDMPELSIGVCRKIIQFESTMPDGVGLPIPETLLSRMRDCFNEIRSLIIESLCDWQDAARFSASSSLQPSCYGEIALVKILLKGSPCFSTNPIAISPGYSIAYVLKKISAKRSSLGSICGFCSRHHVQENNISGSMHRLEGEVMKKVNSFEFS